MNRTKILVVDDEEGYRKVLYNALTERGFQVKTAASGEEALAEFKKNSFSLIVIDMKLPGSIDGLELLQRAKEMNNASILIMTAYGGIDTAVEAMRRGAFNYITKPFSIDEIMLNIERMIEQNKIIEENNYLHSELEKAFGRKTIIGNSKEIQKVMDMISRVAFSSATVLITGESGTGKELVARAIHGHSRRRSKRFVAINCGALPDTLLESELFGYKAGAFTDAKRDKPGRFAIAEGGTILLDEIGDISPAMQARLLRVLQERVYEPLGSVEPVRADVRIIAATAKDLHRLVAEGKFREDLFYRIHVVRLELPALRERREDIPLLVDHFIARFNRIQGRDIAGVSEDVLAALMRHDFPGNVRELENVIEHAFVLCRGPLIERRHLPPHLREDFVPGLVGGCRAG